MRLGAENALRYNVRMSLASRVQVSFLIPIRNEAANLPRCLASIAWAAQVFVVDSQSVDGSQEMATNAGADVVQFKFNGTWPKKKNWALENLPFAHEWVFILDADEVLPPGAEAEIRAVTENPASLAGYWINRRFMFMGKWLRHAYYPNWNLRLFKHRLGRYEKLTEVDTQSGDNEVHEHVIVQGETGRLRCEMDHYAFPSVDVFVEKHNRYSNWEARVALERSLAPTSGRLQMQQVGFRRKLKRLSQLLPLRGLLRFLYVYVGQGGFLDGREGYYFARLHGFYEFLSTAKTYELERRAQRAQGGGQGSMKAGDEAVDASPAENFRTIMGVRFFVGPADEAVRLGMRGGLVVVPSAPVLVAMVEDLETRAALLNSALALTDSGLMVLLWNRIRRDHVRRVSGLEYLHLMLREPALAEPGVTFWIMPNEVALQRCLVWLTGIGYPITRDNFYLAPFYGSGSIRDEKLLETISRLRPHQVFTAVGGGVQERLGYYLQENLPYRPGIHCIGAAIGFLTGDQVRIPLWADAWRIGWLFRVLAAPHRFLPRYWKALRLIPLLLRYQDRMPDEL